MNEEISKVIKNKYEEIEIDLTKHNVEIISKVDGTTNVIVDGEALQFVKRISFEGLFMNEREDAKRKTLKVIIHYPGGSDIPPSYLYRILVNET